MNLKGIIYIAVIGLILTSCNCETDSESSENKAGNTKIEVYDSSVLSIIDTNANFEVLAKGFLWSEGPLWVEDLNSVIFSDVPTNKIFKWNEKDSLSIFLESAGHSGSENKDSNRGPNGLIINKEGQLLICQHGDRRIAVLNSDLSKAENDFITVADNYNGKKFNSPNDLVMDQDGNIYFTDPPYGLADNKTGEIGINGVYKINPEKEVSLLVDTLSMPNGIALSLDEKTLYINQSNPDLPVIYSYNINEDGTLSNGIVFYDFRVS